jgi:type IV pilus assembly protein PilC
LLLKIPILGSVIIKANISRFANIFEILNKRGLPVLQSMTILSNTIGNRAMAKDFENIKSQLVEGGTLSGLLNSSRHFTPMVTSMIAIGEESNRLNDMLKEISVHYDEEVDYSIKKMTEAIAPALTIGLAIIVGFFALSIFVPMADLTKILK